MADDGREWMKKKGEIGLILMQICPDLVVAGRRRVHEKGAKSMRKSKWRHTSNRLTCTPIDTQLMKAEV